MFDLLLRFHFDVSTVKVDTEHLSRPNENLIPVLQETANLRRAQPVHAAAGPLRQPGQRRESPDPDPVTEPAAPREAAEGGLPNPLDNTQEDTAGRVPICDTGGRGQVLPFSEDQRAERSGCLRFCQAIIPRTNGALRNFLRLSERSGVQFNRHFFGPESGPEPGTSCVWSLVTCP